MSHYARARVRVGTLSCLLVAALLVPLGSTAQASQRASGPRPRSMKPVAPQTFEGSLKSLPKARRLQRERAGFDGPSLRSGRSIILGKTVRARGGRGKGGATRGGRRFMVQPSFETPIVSRDGIPFTGFRPPDTNGDVGPNHYVQMVNSSFAIYPKNSTGAALAGPSNINSLWADGDPTTNSLCETTNRGDPIVLYDEMADRWLLSQFAFNTNAAGSPIAPFSQCIAISQGANPVTSGWFLYDFQVHNTEFPDYPKFGVWPDGYYMTANHFGGDGGGGAYVFDRVNMLAGNTAGGLRFDIADRQLLPSDLDGGTPPPAGAPNYFMRFIDGGTDQLEIREFHVDWATPANSTFGNATTINVNAFDSDFCGGFFQSEQCLAQPGTTQGLAVLGDRLMWRLQYRNFGTHETLMANHSVDVGSDQAGVRWYELRRTGGAWGIQQQGTHSPDGTNRWMGSIAMDGEGNIALGYSVSSGTVSPGIRFAGRLVGDPAGTLPQGEYTLQGGNSSQTACQSVDTDGDGTQDFCRGRWGDYSSMSVDPVDDCTFWYTNEYMAGNGNAGNWFTRIGSFNLCNDAPTADANGPYTTDEGTDVTLDGSGSSDPDGDVLSYEWDLDNDGQFDDATGVSPTFDRVGQDGVFTIGLRVTDPYGASDTDQTTVTVDNVAPSVSFSTTSPDDEGATTTIAGTGTDPGWLENLTATVDWGTGGGPQPLPGTLENVRPDATLSFSADHVYGDNGIFTVTVCVADDDTSTCTSSLVQVDNVDPTAEIDESGATDVNGVKAILAHAGETVNFSGNSKDPGSDDLTLDWDWDDGPPSPDESTTYLVNPPNPDPPSSPSVQPRDVTDNKAHIFGDACLYDVVFSARDDDGGSSSDTIKVIITGNADLNRSAGFWQQTYRQPGGKFSVDVLECYLEIVAFMSKVFNEHRDASTIAKAADVLKVNNTSSAAQLLDRQLLAVWLNFANGAMDLTDLVDTNGNGVPDTTLIAAVTNAETVRLNPASTKQQLLAQKNILESINLQDE
jgi:hypothetical protein